MTAQPGPTLAEEEPQPHEPDTDDVVVPWSLWDTLVVFILVYFAAALAGSLLAVMLPDERANEVFFPVSTALTGVVTLAFVIARHRFAGVRALFGPRAFRRSDILSGAAHGIAAFLVINIGFALLMELLVQVVGGELPTVQEGLREAAADAEVLFFISAILIAPVAEELFFRGLLFQKLRQRLGLWPGAGLSAVLFAALHYEPGNVEGSLYAFLVLVPVGMYFAWVFHRRGNIVAAVMMHMVFNGLGVVGIASGLG